MLFVRPVDRITKDMVLHGLDLTWRGDPWYLRAEWVGGPVEELDAGRDFRREGWYAEVYRRIDFGQSWLDSLEMAFRVDVLDDDSRVHDHFDVSRYSFGFNWSPRQDLRLKTEYQISDERFDEISNNGFFLQLVWNF